MPRRRDAYWSFSRSLHMFSASFSILNDISASRQIGDTLSDERPWQRSSAARRKAPDGVFYSHAISAAFRIDTARFTLIATINAY